MTGTKARAVAVIGVGAIGMPMAQRLAARGFAVSAVDPNPSARATADGHGMSTYASIAALPAQDVVIVLVATGQQLLAAVRAGAERSDVGGESWVITSTVGPDVARQAADVLSSRGAAVVDAPVTGGVPGAESGTLRLLTAGAPEHIDGLEDVFDVLGDVIVVGEQVGDGQATKLVNQLCSSVHLVVAAEAIALAARLGLDPIRTANVIAGGSGSSWFFDERGPRMAALPESVTPQTRLAILAKDNELVDQVASVHGAQVPLLRAARSQYAKAKVRGLLEEDDSQIIRIYLS